MMGTPELSEEWKQLGAAFDGVPYAVIGAVAANWYMPSRATADIDFAIAARDQRAAAAVLTRARWATVGELTVNEPLSRSVWRSSTETLVDVLVVPGLLGNEIVDTAQDNLHDGVPHATLAYLVVLKMIAGRLVDPGDLGRMLGHQDEVTLEAVRSVARRFLGSEDLSDLQQIIELGRLEYEGRSGVRQGAPGESGDE